MKNTPKHTNRLIDETSPYLLQHAHNPVDWYPWGEEALNLAKNLDKPILLSIGYSACHWCHVMERGAACVIAPGHAPTFPPRQCPVAVDCPSPARSRYVSADRHRG